MNPHRPWIGIAREVGENGKTKIEAIFLLTLFFNSPQCLHFETFTIVWNNTGLPKKRISSIKHQVFFFHPSDYMVYPKVLLVGLITYCICALIPPQFFPQRKHRGKKWSMLKWKWKREAIIASHSPIHTHINTQMVVQLCKANDSVSSSLEQSR